MAELLKNIYNEKFFDRFISGVKKVQADFDAESFLENIYDTDWEVRALKERMRHITLVLKDHWSTDYKKNTKTILKLIPALLKNGFTADNLEFIFFPDFIECYGLEDYHTSVKAFEKITQFVTCEFAVRPFILKYPEKMMAQFNDWSTHKHPAVRRLSTEGCRPRLPWAMGVPAFKRDPTPILPILKRLKSDVSESVRRSVANNLNDISKDHPQIVIELVKNWKGKNRELDRLVKHASRTLLKQGNPEVMRLFDFGSVEDVKINNLQVENPKIRIGESLEFSFELISKSNSDSKIRLEYGVYYQKANGTLSRKVNMISEKIYEAKSKTQIRKKQPFKVITTRRLHVGRHEVSVIVNGVEFDKREFELKD